MANISDLTKTIQNKTSEQAKNTEQIVNSVFKTLNESLTSKADESVSIIKNDLETSRTEIQKILDNHKALIQTELKQILKSQNWFWAMIGGLTSLLLLTITILILVNVYMTAQVQALASEKARLDKALEQMPVEARILDKVGMGEIDGYYYIVSKDNITQAYTNNDGQTVMKMKAD